ncbi:MAG: sigma-70 family RNA polymerase sigma factor [Planctomycetes bacterium]|nr:sigma-70 family RNA polymerase sigma factor [Planctomycetota bacterium]
MEAPSTTTLVADFASGRREAFRDLYRRVAPRLYVWCALRIPQALHARIDPDDLMQEVWLRCVRTMPKFDRSVAAFRTWLFGIAANTLAENLRNLNVRRREQVLESPDAGLDRIPADVTSVIGTVARREQARRLVAACRDLPADDLRLLIHRGLEELPHAEVARLLDIGPEAAEMRWRRLQKKLQHEWASAGLGET